MKSKSPVLEDDLTPYSERVTIAFATTARDPFVRSFLSLASAFLGARFVLSEVGSSKSLVVCYGDAVGDNRGFSIPRSAGFTRETVPLVKLPLSSVPNSARQFPFDLIKATEFWITDQAHLETCEADLDRHRRVRSERTLVHQLGVAETPMVNNYLLLFKQWLKEKMGLALPGHLPPGKKCIVMLSHDVDTPVDPADVTHDFWRIGWSGVNGHLGCIPGELLRVARKLKNWRATRHEKHWLFEEIATAEARHGFSSTFFFSAIASPVSRHGYDVTYDIRAPRFRKVFQMLQSKGFEIGLHGSYRSSEKAESFQSEMDLLRQCCGGDVLGNRQHCWKLLDDKWKSVEFMARAGLAYDSSIAFNDIAGFRVGVSFPFHPFYPGPQKALPIMELPVMLMDGAYFYRQEPGVEEVVHGFNQLLKRLKECEGVGAIDWHVTTAFPGSQRYRKWGEAYVAILRVLAADREVAVMNCAEVYKYYRQVYQTTGSVGISGEPALQT